MTGTNDFNLRPLMNASCMTMNDECFELNASDRSTSRKVTSHWQVIIIEDKVNGTVFTKSMDNLVNALCLESDCRVCFASNHLETHTELL